MQRAAFLVLLFGGAIWAQVTPAPPGGVYKVGGGVSAPRLVSKVEPEYSEEASRLGVNSTVVLNLVVGADGSPRDLTVARRSGFGLDEKALESVSKWRFKPGTKGDDPVAVFASVEVTFRLLDFMDPAGTDLTGPGAAKSARIVYLPADGKRPMAIGGRLPKHVSPTPVTFRFSFEVSENGTVENLICAEAVPEPVLDAVRKLRFEPAKADGRPIRVVAKLDLSY